MGPKALPVPGPCGDDRWVPELLVLDPAQCERLLRRGNFGRVGLVTSRGPDVVPVNYTVVEDSVVVRTTSDGLLARHGHQQPLVFEVDLVDHERWEGWSVTARGVGEVVPEAGSGRRPAVRAWATGERSAQLHLPWTELTGRRLGAGWDLEAGMYARRTAR